MQDFVGKPEGKRILGRPMRRWGNNIVTDPKETGLGGRGVDWIHLSGYEKLRALLTLRNLRVSQNTWKILISLVC